MFIIFVNRTQYLVLTFNKFEFMKKILLLLFMASSGVYAQLYTNNTSVTLTDATGTGICGSAVITPGNTASTINVPITAQIADPNLVIFSVAINHTWVTDLVVRIENPAATSCGLLKRAAAATLADNGCGTSSNLVAANALNFSASYATAFVPVLGDATNNPGGNFAPSGQIASAFPNTVTLCNLSTFLANAQIAGDWNLRVTDYGVGDTGDIATWSINFQAGSLLGNPEFGAIFSSALSVMQNPFNEQLSLRANLSNLETLSFDVYAMDGKLIYSNTLASFENNLLTVDTSSWSKGTYVLVPTKNGKTDISLKVIKN